MKKRQKNSESEIDPSSKKEFQMRVQKHLLIDEREIRVIRLKSQTEKHNESRRFQERILITHQFFYWAMKSINGTNYSLTNPTREITTKLAVEKSVMECSKRLKCFIAALCSKKIKNNKRIILSESLPLVN